MTLRLRYMTLDDIGQVVSIDREAFSTPWSPRSYIYEVSESSYSHMVVLDHVDEVPVQGWKRLLRNIGGGGEDKETQSMVLGYGGLWSIVDEAHISTIATRADHRGNGYGEILLAAMIRRSIMLEASYIVLEVRVSNTVAQALYRKYEFQVFGTKPRYYRDDGEDAYDMRLMLEEPGVVGRFHQRFEAVRQRHTFTDTYTQER